MKTSLFGYLRQKSLAFHKNDRGSMAIFMAFGAIAFVGIAGLSVDAARGYLVQARLASALDAAGLAGARVMFSPDRDAEILKYFNANFPPNYLGASVTPPVPPPVTPGQTTLSLTASAIIDTTLTSVFGIHTMQVSAVSGVTRSTPSLDVVIAMDMSGSMDSNLGGNTRLEHAIVASKSMTDILFNDPNVIDLNIGLVPWSSKVNVTDDSIAFDPALTITLPVANFTNPITGASQSNVFYANNSPVPLLVAPPALEPLIVDDNGDGEYDRNDDTFSDLNGNGVYDKAWHGCVFARYDDDVSSTNDADLDVGPLFGVGGNDWPAWEPVDGNGEPDTDNNRCSMANNYSSTCVPCLSQGITPLQSTQAAIDAEIDNLNNPVGSTEMIGGLAWAWRVLVPEAPFTEAPADPNNQRIKAIILLTDGAYTGWYNDDYKRAFGGGSSARPEGPNRLIALGDRIKATGVRVYVIQFTTTTGQADMKAVATAEFPPFYNAPASGADLEDVFREIADDLVELHISS